MKSYIKERIEKIIHGDSLKSCLMDPKQKKENIDTYNIFQNVYLEHKNIPTLDKLIKTEKPLEIAYEALKKEENDSLSILPVILGDIIFTTFLRDIEAFITKEKRWPHFKDDIIKNFCKAYGITEKQYLQFIEKIATIHFMKDARSVVQMKMLLGTAFKQDKKLFLSFFIANLLEKEGHKCKEFQELGEKIKPIIERVENELVKKMENGKYADMSSSVSQKFKNYLASYFPLYNMVGVKVKKLTPEEMKAYIKEQYKK